MASPQSPVSQEPILQGGKRFFPIQLASLRIDSVPRFSLYFRPSIDQPFVLYCEKNVTFGQAALDRLRENRVRQLFIRDEERSAYSRYLAEHLYQILDDKHLTVRDKSVILYDSAQAVVEDVLGNPSSREHIEHGKKIVGHTVDFMSRDDFLLEHLLRTISCDYYLYTHSVNVVAYSVALAMEAGHRDKATLREIANGALLHDVGKSALDPELVNKRDSLNADEWRQVQEHAKKGLVLVQKSGSLGEIALDIINHHHEKLDGTGYPDHLEGDQISVFVRMVTIADVFDALTTDRHHQKARNTFDALKIMNGEMRHELDPRLLRLFVTMMGGAKAKK
ncbi:MAG: HD domain-containing protein [Candidatus Hydrogenedentes bacterium]|nr:HD domain-containing protein [Candidatus Hydrogenedentota bacterium]